MPQKDEGALVGAKETESERQDIKPITGMFERIQEEVLKQRRKERSTLRAKRTRTEATSLGLVDPKVNCALVPSWEGPNAEHFTPQGIQESTRPNLRTLYCMFALDNKSVSR